MSPGPSEKKGKNPKKKSFMEQYREYLKKEQTARNATKKDDASKKKDKEDKGKDTAVQEPEEEIAEVEEAPRKKTKEEKQKEHLLRIKKTLIACGIGIVTGIISYLIINPSQILGLQNYTILALLIMISGIVVQRHVFILLKLGSDKMGAKDWLYQGFMTFAFWFITWTILLTKGA